MSETEPEPRTIYISGGWLAGVFVVSALVGLAGGALVASGSLVFGGICVALACSGLWWVLIGTLTSKTPLVAMDTAGIFDRRVARRFIRWVDVLSVQPLVGRGIQGAVLVLRPGVLGKLHLSPLARVLAAVRRWTAFEGVAIVAWGTQVNGEQLYNWCLAYSRAHKFEVDKENV